MRERESQTELLRLVALFGIVVMHCYGPFLQQPTALNLFCGELCCAVFNTGVSVFMLISGYYGLRGTWRKALGLWLTVLLYSLLSAAVTQGLGGHADWLKALHPITAGSYWFITGYMLILLCSPLINRMAERAGKRGLQLTVGLLFAVFCILPFLLGGHLFNDGKNPANMLLVYLIGRYLRLHGAAAYPNLLTGGAAAAALAAVFCGNYGLSLYLGRTMLPLAAEQSPLIPAAAVGIFLYSRSFRFVSPRLNAVARHVLAIYLFEGALRKLLFTLLPLSACSSAWYFPLLIVAAAGGICAVCLAVDALRTALLRVLYRCFRAD